MRLDRQVAPGTLSNHGEGLQPEVESGQQNDLTGHRKFLVGVCMANKCPEYANLQHEVQLTLHTLSDLTRAMLDAFHNCDRDRFAQLDKELESTVGRWKDSTWPVGKNTATVNFYRCPVPGILIRISAHNRRSDGQQKHFSPCFVAVCNSSEGLGTERSRNESNVQCQSGGHRLPP